jgi:hypothetical protein
LSQANAYKDLRQPVGYVLQIGVGPILIAQRVVSCGNARAIRVGLLVAGRAGHSEKKSHEPPHQKRCAPHQQATPGHREKILRLMGLESITDDRQHSECPGQKEPWECAAITTALAMALWAQRHHGTVRTFHF